MRFYVELRRPDGSVYRPEWFPTMEAALAFAQAWRKNANYTKVGVRAV